MRCSTVVDCGGRSGRRVRGRRGDCSKVNEIGLHEADYGRFAGERHGDSGDGADRGAATASSTRERVLGVLEVLHGA